MKFKTALLLVSCLLLSGCNNSKTDNSKSENTESTTTTTIITTTKATEPHTKEHTESPTEKPEESPNENTFIGSSISIDVPKNWKLTKTGIYDSAYPTVMSIFQNGDFSFILEEVEVVNKSDTEIFDERIKQFFYEKTCDYVEIYELNNIKFAKSYYTNNSDFCIYMFVNNGIMYQFDITGLSLLSGGENAILNVINSIRYDSIEDIDKFYPNSNTLSSENKTYFLQSISGFTSFSYPDTIKINKCCETSINNKQVLVYDLEYISSSNNKTSNTYLYYPETNKNTMSDKTYSDTINGATSDIIEHDSNILNQILNNYYNQFNEESSSVAQTDNTIKHSATLIETIKKDDIQTPTDPFAALDDVIDRLRDGEEHEDDIEIDEPDINDYEEEIEEPDEEPPTEILVEVETKPDNSRQIKRLESKIANCYSDIELYESFVSRRQDDILDYQSKLDSAIIDLENAQSNLEKAKEDGVRVYSADRGWHYAPDAEAVANAESEVSRCQGWVDSYNERISKLNSEIEDYTNKINEKNAEIESYQAEIESLL